jgi:hypothetical protein
LIYGVILAWIALLSTQIIGEILLLKHVSALTHGTYEDFRQMLFVMMYAFCVSAVGAVLFNVEYALYDMEVFKQIGFFCILAAFFCALYICSHFFFMEGGTWNRLASLQVKKGIMCVALVAVYVASIYLFGGLSEIRQGVLMVFVLVIAVCGLCLCSSGGNTGPRGVTLLQP